MNNINQSRIFKLNEFELKDTETNKKIIYWMKRDVRAEYNWALQYAANISMQTKSQLIVLFNFVPYINPDYKIKEYTHYKFLIDGLIEVENKLRSKFIDFVVLYGNPKESIYKFIKENKKCILLITDFSPLKLANIWNNEILEKLNKIEIPFHVVDAHNIVPVWSVSNKAEYAAVHFRKKIMKKIDEFFYNDDLKKLVYKNKTNQLNYKKTDWNTIWDKLNFSENEKIGKKEWKGGSSQAKKTLKIFIENKFNKYAEYRNNPNKNYCTNLSPYLHFGNICSQYIISKIIKDKTKSVSNNENFKSLFEEMVIRKELSDNFCYYNKNYDNFDGLPLWSKETLILHLKDKRKYIYTLKELENAETYDELWNACQLEMVNNQKMSGYMRMYWMKKIIEWTKSPKKAIEIGIYLNDKYNLDGRDPNGYVGILWSCGLHDRPFKESKILGKVRPMTFNGCKKKFNIIEYISNNNPSFLEEESGEESE